MERKRAEQRVRFIDQYRSYVINYNLGEDLVREYVEKNVERRTSNIEHRSGEDAERAKFEARWQIFGELLSSPRLPSGLR
jgi:hypothetical protein